MLLLFDAERCCNGRIDRLQSDGSIIVTVDAIVDPSPIDAISTDVPVADEQEQSENIMIM